MSISPLLRSLIEREFVDSENENPILSYGFGLIHKIDPLIQQGPQCGLVALKSSAAILQIESPTVMQIFEHAKCLEFTKNGEIFSVEWMKKLSEDLLPCYATVVDQTQVGCYLNILNSLIKRKSVLIPYDCDKNHQPCLNDGKTAHWALLIGFLLVSENVNFLTNFKDYSTEDSNFNSLFWLQHENSSIVKLHESDLAKCKNVFVMALHGKSKHPGLWSLKDLLISNSQLTEFNPTRAQSDIEYILPVDGVKALKNKFIILSKIVVETSTSS